MFRLVPQTWRPTAAFQARLSPPHRASVCSVFALSAHDPKGRPLHPSALLHRLPLELLCYLCELVIGRGTVRNYAQSREQEVIEERDGEYPQSMGLAVLSYGLFCVLEGPKILFLTARTRREIAPAVLAGLDVETHSIAVTPDGLLAISIYTQNRVVLLTCDGDLVRSIDVGNKPETGGPSGIAVDSNGTIVVGKRDHIVLISSDGVISSFPIPDGGLLADVAITHEGNIVACDICHSRVMMFAPTGELLLMVKPGKRMLSLPRYVAVDAAGNIVVATMSPVLVLDPRDGHVIARFGPWPRGMASHDTDDDLDEEDEDMPQPFDRPKCVAVLDDGGIVVGASEPRLLVL